MTSWLVNGRPRQFILSGLGPDAPAGTNDAHAFRFDMNRVFEDWLTVALTAVLEPVGGTVRRQTPLVVARDSDTRQRSIARTDITWWQGQTCLAVVDAKSSRQNNLGF